MSDPVETLWEQKCREFTSQEVGKNNVIFQILNQKLDFVQTLQEPHLSPLFDRYAIWWIKPPIRQREERTRPPPIKWLRFRKKREEATGDHYEESCNQAWKQIHKADCATFEVTKPGKRWLSELLGFGMMLSKWREIREKKHF